MAAKFFQFAFPCEKGTAHFLPATRFPVLKSSDPTIFKKMRHIPGKLPIMAKCHETPIQNAMSVFKATCSLIPLMQDFVPGCFPNNVLRRANN